MRSVLLLAFAFAATAASADDASLVRHQYAEQAAAVNSSNPKRLFATIDPAFTQLEPNGRTIKYAEYRQGLTQMLGAFKSGTMKFKLGQISFAVGKLKGGKDGKIASVDYTVEGDLVARTGQKIHDVEQGRDTWQKVGGTYLQIHEVIKSSKMTPVGVRKSV